LQRHAALVAGALPALAAIPVIARRPVQVVVIDLFVVRPSTSL
jgi:hypothetical protein